MDSFQHPDSHEPYFHLVTVYLLSISCSLTCDYSVSQWHRRDARSRGTPVLSARSPSPRTPPHPDPSCCPPTRWLHSQEACLLRHCPAVVQTPPSLCPTHGPTRERTPLNSETPVPGETQQSQQRVNLVKSKNLVASLYHLFINLHVLPLQETISLADALPDLFAPPS